MNTNNRSGAFDVEAALRDVRRAEIAKKAQARGDQPTAETGDDASKLSPAQFRRMMREKFGVMI